MMRVLLLIGILLFALPALGQQYSVGANLSFDKSAWTESADLIVLSIGKGGELRLGTKVVPAGLLLTDILRTNMALQTSRAIALCLDGDASYDRFLEILGQLRAAGIERVQLLKQRPPTSPLLKKR